MSASTWVAVGLALATAMAWARLAVWPVEAPVGAQTRSWRLAILLIAQPLLAGLIYLTLFPPPSPAAGANTLMVATRGAPLLIGPAGGLRIDLPEAAPSLGAEPAPDLATALRRHPGTRRLRILGEGLEPRDRAAAAGLALSFTPPPARAGLSELHRPERVAPGDAFEVAGTVEGARGGSVELLDPAGRIVDARPLSSTGGFTLTAAARDPGPALFAVHVRDLRHAIIETADVPVWIAADPGPRVLLLAGAPGPEVKQLRRWAQDAGMALQASVGAGDGLELGEAQPPLDAATLDSLDLVVVDERSWLALGAGDRAALIAATRGGMGLLLRVTGPVPAVVREQWSALGLPLGSGDESAVMRLAANASRAPASSGAIEPADALPPLTRRVVDVPAPGAARLAQDAASDVLGRWRAVGRGRAGVWAVTDSSGLVTAGFADRYGELWSTLFATLARTSLTPAPSLDMSSAAPRAGQRLSVCGIADGAEMLGPHGGATRLLVDPAVGPAGCASYWPFDAGWRLMRSPAGKGQAQDLALYVYPSDAMPGVRARELRDGTWALAGASRMAEPAGTKPGPPGPAWPWFLMLLTAGASLWRFERAHRGRSTAPG